MTVYIGNIKFGSGKTTNMKVNQIGEFKLIEILAKTLSDNYKHTNPETVVNEVVSLGDDAAAWNITAGPQVLTTDTLVDNVHFDLNLISAVNIGWKSIVASQSDIAAMGLKPLFATVSLGLTGNEDVNLLKDIYIGMADATSRFGGKVVGGDTVRSNTFFISISMIGHDVFSESHTAPLQRSMAKDGDLIAVTGYLGSSSGGLQILQNKTIDQSKYRNIIESHTRPQPQVDVGSWIVRNGIKCATDISDGLIADLEHICKASNVGMKIIIDSIPVSSELKNIFPNDWRLLSMTGGEDYQLVFTGDKELIYKAIKTLTTPITVIGEVNNDYPKISVFNKNGGEINYTYSGFDHFENKKMEIS